MGGVAGAAQVIADITRRMGAGMAEFIEKEVESVADYDLYCHYVAGLVGVGLSQARALSGSDSTAHWRGCLRAPGGALSRSPASQPRLRAGGSGA
jgi:phytoene/squalene synthetase